MFQSLGAVGGHCRALEGLIKNRVQSKKHLALTKTGKLTHIYVEVRAAELSNNGGLLKVREISPDDWAELRGSEWFHR